MSKPIAPTPNLDIKSSLEFIRQAQKQLKIKSYPIPTPKIDETVKGIMDCVQKAQPLINSQS